MKALFVFSLFIFLLSACSMSTKYSNHQIEEVLNKRYGEDFKVIENHFVFNIQQHQFRATLKNNSEVVVDGTYGKDRGDIDENYPQMLHTYQAKLYVENFLDDYFKQIAIKATSSSKYHTDTKTKPIDFFALMNNIDYKSHLSINIYLFETVNKDSYKEFLKGIVAIIEELEKWKNNTYYLSIHFWDEESFKGKDIEKFKFGFNVYNETYYDSMAVENELIKQVIYLEFDSKKDREPITVDRLFENIHPFDKGKGFREKIVRF